MNGMFGMGPEFDFFVLEQEGLLPTREGRINAAIKEFQRLKRLGTLSNADIEPVLNKFDLSKDVLTDIEVQKIQQTVMGRF